MTRNARLAQALAAAKEREAREQKVRALKPTWEDYVSEGVIDHVPEPDENGNISIPVKGAGTDEGHRNVVRALQMNEAANRVESDLCDEAYANVPRSTVTDHLGRKREVEDHRAEQADRKFHSIRNGKLTAACHTCSRQVVLPERVLRLGLKRPSCKQCGGPLQLYASSRVA